MVRAVAAGFAATLVLLGGQAAPAKPEAAKPAEETKAEPAKPAVKEYATSVVCQGCHEEIYNTFFKRNAHRLLETNKRKGYEEKACESCHGMGSVHAETASPDDILNPGKMKPASADRVCLTCHLNQPTQAGRIMGGHARGQVRCSECHSVHATQPSSAIHKGSSLLAGGLPSSPNQRVQMQTGTCVRCHSASWGEFQRPHRHNVPEGSMTCSDCHNPHGGTKRSMWLNAGMREPGCFKCHGDKRGPFTFEHAPVRLEGCPACHQPHGSVNPRMLTRHEVRFQCLECHSNLPVQRTANEVAPSGSMGGVPPAFHDLRNPRYRNCTTCHWKIHGSHVNRAFTR
jgi:predicted CXXCH cytochrome family protein